MNRSIILAVGIVLLGALVADAKTIPVSVTAGNIAVGCSRNSYDATYDLVEFYLTGMTGSANGVNTDGGQVRINIIEGRWTAGNGGAFWIPSTLASLKSRSTNAFWETPTYSTVNFDSTVSGATIWTNTAGGGGQSGSGNLYNFFSGSWYTTDYAANLVYGTNGQFPLGPNPGYTGGGTNSSYLAAFYVTKATPDIGLGFGIGGGSGKFAFTYGGGTVENTSFITTPEPATLTLLAAGLIGLVAYAWRKRRQ